MNKKPRPILLAYCCPDMVHSMFAYAMAQMYARACGDGMHVGLMQIQTTEISVGRNTVAENFLKTDASHLLFMDSDMIFPVTALGELLNANKAIVGCTYSKRRSPRGYTHTSLNGDWSVPHDNRRYFRVRGLGMGLVLIRREVFEAIPAPWFESRYNGARGEDCRVIEVQRDPITREMMHTSEDNTFFAAAREKGFDVWCDWELSQRVRHIGCFEFGLEHVEVLPTHIIGD